MVMFRKRFLCDIRAAADVEALRKVIADVGTTFGFDGFVYASWPSNWRNRSRLGAIVSCDSLMRFFSDPTIAHADDRFIVQVMNTIRPTCWSLEAGPQTSPLTKEFKQLGFRLAWATGERDSNNNLGFVGFLRRRSDPAPRDTRDDDELAWMSFVIHLHGGEVFARMRRATLSTALSERECEVLRWTGDGKTSEEISSILAISKNTVNFHVKNACLKLGCSNKTSSVVTAMKMGLL